MPDVFVAVLADDHVSFFIPLRTHFFTGLVANRGRLIDVIAYFIDHIVELVFRVLGGIFRIARNFIKLPLDLFGFLFVFFGCFSIRLFLSLLIGFRGSLPIGFLFFLLLHRRALLLAGNSLHHLAGNLLGSQLAEHIGIGGGHRGKRPELVQGVRSAGIALPNQFLVSGCGHFCRLHALGISGRIDAPNQLGGIDFHLAGPAGAQAKRPGQLTVDRETGPPHLHRALGFAAHASAERALGFGRH